MEKRLQEHHDRSTHNFLAVRASSTCGCFYCLATFPPSAIVEWTDANMTAICPRCGVDAVLPREPDEKLLREMQEVWFDGFGAEGIG